MTGKRIGYIRVSTTDQNPDRQLENIDLDKKFIEYATGSTIKRPQLEIMMDYAREDDIIIVHSMDRLARNVKDLRRLIDDLTSKGVRVYFIKENLTFSFVNSPMDNLMLMLIGSIAEFELSLIKERQMEGIAYAKKSGKYKGRKSKFTKENIEKIKIALQTRKSKTKIAQELGLSRFTLYRYLEKIHESEMIS